MAIPRLKTKDGTSYCSNCNHEVGIGAGNCPNCGMSFDSDRDAERCTFCGTPNLPGSISCLKCGRLLQTVDFGHEGVGRPEKHDKEESPPDEPVSKEMEPPDEEKQKAELEDAKRRTQHLWMLSEPFEKVMRSRRRRLAKINYMLERTKEKLAALEESRSPEDEEAKEKLRRQIGEIMAEKEEIVSIEECIAEMERIYRNLLALQESELRKKQEALKERLESFEEKVEEWAKERNGLKSKEHDLKAREDEIQRKIKEMELKEKNLAERERALKERMRELRKEELEIMKMKFREDASISTKKGWLEKEDGNYVVLSVDHDGKSKKEEEVEVKLAKLEEELKRAVEERERIKEANERIIREQEDVKRVLKILDDLLEKLPDEEIKRFANSGDFKLYQKVLEQFEM